MYKTISKRLAFLKHKHGTRIDPRARAAGAFDLLEFCFITSNFQRPRKSKEFEATRYAVQTLLGIVYQLHKLVFWEHLRPEDAYSYVREEMLARTRENLQDKGASLEDIVEAMDTINGAVRTMSHSFRLGRFDPLDALSDSVVEGEPDDESEEDEDENTEVAEEDDEDDDRQKQFERDWTFARYKCAALLPYLEKRIRRVWVPIKKKISKPRKKEGRKITVFRSPE